MFDKTIGEVIEDLAYARGQEPARIKTFNKDVRVQQVIITTNARRGDGVKEPIRRILQVWSMDGDLIAERDYA